MNKLMETFKYNGEEYGFADLEARAQIEELLKNSPNAAIDVDQSYNPDSENAQSGKAVKEAVSKIITIEETILSHSANYMPDRSEFIYAWITDSLKLYESSGNMLSPFIEIDESLIGKKLTIQRKAGFVWERMGYVKSVTAFNSITEPDDNNFFNSAYVIESLPNITKNSADGTYAVYTIPEGTKYLRVSIGNDTVTNENYQTMFVINDDESLLGEYVANESVSIEGKKELAEDVLVNSSNLILQSSNGGKYTLTVTDEGIIAGKDENDEIVLPNIPTKTSELENDNNFITEQYYKDNREFYDDRAVSKTFTLQTILNPAGGFTLTAKNDSYDFFSNLREYYKITQHGYRDWYVVDRLAVSYDKGEWLNFESGEDYLVLVTYRDNYDRCELAVYNHAGDKLLWYDGTLRDAEGNISYDWGVLGLNTDIIPIPDISGLDIINLDFAFYGTTGELKKLDRKFIDLELPSKVSELENDSNFITISDVDLSGYVEKIEMPEIDIDEVIEKTTDGVNRYEPLTEGWIDNSEITQNGENFESNSNYYCITPKIRVWTDREYVATLNNERYHGYIAMYDASGNYIQTNYINDGVFHTHIQINAQTLSVNYVCFNVDRKNDITTTIEDFNNYFKLELLSNYRLKDTVQLPEAVTPSAPTKVSELENDVGYITADSIPEIDTSDIPTKISELENDSKFISESYFSTLIDNEEPTYGEELASADGWISDGWTGDFANGFTHTTGNTNSLIFTMPEDTAQNTYRISFRCSESIAVEALMVKCGGSDLFDLYGQPYDPVILGITSVENGNIEFVPASTFKGTITDISIKRVTGFNATKQTITDSTGEISCETRTTKSSLNNVFIGKHSGENNISGVGCAAVGSSALKNNTSGFWNVGIGLGALRDNTVGSRNVGIGYIALAENITGTRNVALGTFALNHNKTGNKNIAIGSDCLDHNVSGSFNVGIGFQTLYSNVSGNQNTAIGAMALKAVTGNANVGIGYSAGAAITTGSNNCALGVNSLYKLKTGNDNIAIGAQAGRGQATTTGFNYVICIGRQTGYNLGNNANANIFIGNKAGYSVTTGGDNICIGSDADTPTPTTSRWVNIGDLYEGSAKATDKYAKINGGLQLSDIPTTDPAIAGRVWNDNGTLKVSAG